MNDKGNTAMLLLKLLESGDMYGYQMIEELKRRSDDTFTLKAGTLYPLLKNLENEGYLTSYGMTAPSGKERTYYALTDGGKCALAEKIKSWNSYSKAVAGVLKGGTLCHAE